MAFFLNFVQSWRQRCRNKKNLLIAADYARSYIFSFNELLKYQKK